MGRRIQYWEHFIAAWACGEIEIGNGVTRTRLKRVKPIIMQDDAFWADVLDRHGGLNRSPYQMKADEPAIYEHCLGNFAGMLYQSIQELSVKSRDF